MCPPFPRQEFTAYERNRKPVKAWRRRLVRSVFEFGGLLVVVGASEQQRYAPDEWKCCPRSDQLRHGARLLRRGAGIRLHPHPLRSLLPDPYWVMSAERGRPSRSRCGSQARVGRRRPSCFDARCYSGCRTTRHPPEPLPEHEHRRGDLAGRRVGERRRRPPRAPAAARPGSRGRAPRPLPTGKNRSRRPCTTSVGTSDLGQALAPAGRRSPAWRTPSPSGRPSGPALPCRPCGPRCGRRSRARGQRGRAPRTSAPAAANSATASRSDQSGIGTARTAGASPPASWSGRSSSGRPGATARVPTRVSADHAPRVVERGHLGDHPADADPPRGARARRRARRPGPPRRRPGPAGCRRAPPGPPSSTRRYRAGRSAPTRRRPAVRRSRSRVGPGEHRRPAHEQDERRVGVTKGLDAQGRPHPRRRSVIGSPARRSPNITPSTDANVVLVSFIVRGTLLASFVVVWTDEWTNRPHRSHRGMHLRPLVRSARASRSSTTSSSRPRPHHRLDLGG